MQVVRTYIPEARHVPREHTVAANLSLLFIVSLSVVSASCLFFFYVSSFRSTCSVPLLLLLLLLLLSPA